MKKLFFILVVLCTIMLAFGQISDPEIARIISQSREYNSHVADPDWIYPGQMLSFHFTDGTIHWMKVEKGDVQWKMIKKLDELIKKHGPIVHPDSIQQPVVVTPESEQSDTFTQSEPFPWWANVPWGWILLLIFILVIFAKLLQIRHKERNQDPITAGPAQIPGGVNDTGAHNRMRQVAENRFPGSRLDIRNIRRGRLSGLATVHYASGKPKKLRLKGTPAYAGEVIVNGNTETIYFLQGCGNDARQGNFMSGNLVFEPDVVINEDGSESPLPTPVTAESVVEHSALIVSESVRSEYDGQIAQAMKLAEKVVTDNPSHEVSIEIPKGEGSFRMTIKAQYPSKEKKSGAEK